MLISVTIVVTILIILLISFLYIYASESRMVKETFIENTITVEVVDEKAYILNNTFRDQCTGAIIKPTDVFMTNIIHYFHNVDNVDFIGICNGHRSCVIASKNNSIKNVSDIPITEIIGYSNEADKYLFDRILTRAYTKSFSFEKITDKIYVSEYCDTYDNTDNMFIDFMSSDINFFIFSFSSVFDTKLHEYYNSFFKQRLRPLSMNNETISNHIFNSKITSNNTVLNVDNIIYSNKSDGTVDYNKLISNEYINFELTQKYIDLYNCDVPYEISKHMIVGKVVSPIMTVRTDDLSNSKDSCHEDSLIKSAQNAIYNPHGIHIYKSTRCEASKNNFIDIVYPFSSGYDMKLSSSDFNQLLIKSSKFDDIIPINNAVKKNNGYMPRYKVNVDPIKYPTEAYIDDIYYGAYADDDDNFTILTNSIPFDLDKTKHAIKYDLTTSDEIIISFLDDTNIVAFYNYKNIKTTVNLLEGDRVYINPGSIFDAELFNHIYNQLKSNINLFHGFVENDETGTLVIKLENIRDTGDMFKGLNMKCFNEKLEEVEGDNINCTNEQACKYNHECPFFKSNSNYDNNFGGCDSSGVCQMPIGISKRSFKNYIIDDVSKPLCNNCSITDTDKACCDNFKNNPNMTSPDYMYDNDTEQRIKHLFMLNDDNETATNPSKCGTLYINKYF